MGGSIGRELRQPFTHQLLELIHLRRLPLLSTSLPHHCRTTSSSDPALTSLNNLLLKREPKPELRERERTTREARAKTCWGQGPIYTASHDPQSRSREVHFGDRARRAKIGRSGGGGGEGECVQNVSHGLPWRLKELGAWGLKKG